MPPFETIVASLERALEWALKSELGRATSLALVLVYFLGWWRVFGRAGFPPALAFLMLLPPLVPVLWLFLAFAPWPYRRELAALRKVQRVVHQAERRKLAA